TAYIANSAMYAPPSGGEGAGRRLLSGIMRDTTTSHTRSPLGRCRSLSLPYVNQPGQTDAQHVEADHRNPDDKERGQVGSGSDARGENGGNEDGVAQILHQKLRSDNAEQGQDQNNDR